MLCKSFFEAILPFIGEMLLIYLSDCAVSRMSDSAVRTTGILVNLEERGLGSSRPSETFLFMIR